MVRIRHILCPIDFSESSRHAFDRAVGVARCYDASISVLHVLPAISGIAAVPFGPEGPGAFGRHAADREQILSEMPRFLAIESPIDIPVEFNVIDAPSVHKAVLAEAERLSTDLVVIGTHGRSGFDRLMLGSVAEKVLRTSPVPVLTVPPLVPDVVPLGRDPFKRILYATDFSEGSEAALRYAASLAQHGAAQLTVIHVVEPIPIGHDPLVGTAFDATAYQTVLEEEARSRLRTVVPESIRLGCDTDDVLVKGRPYVEILRVAAERQADLIVMGVHGRNAVDRLVWGSTAEQIVRRATCPVLTVRAPE